MKKKFLYLFLVFLCFSLYAEENEIDQAIKKLDQLDRLYLSDVHPDKRKIIKDEITQIRELLRQYQDRALGKKLERMDSSFFQDLLNKLKAVLPDTKAFISLCKNNAVKEDLTVKQLVAILDLLTSNDDKIKVLKVLYPSVIDQENKHQFYNAIPSMFKVKEIQKIIGD